MNIFLATATGNFPRIPPVQSAPDYNRVIVEHHDA